MPEKTSEMEDAALWLWCFLGVGFASAIGVYFALFVGLQQNAYVSGALAILLGAVIGFLSAQIRIVRKVVGGLVESVIFWVS